MSPLIKQLETLKLLDNSGKVLDLGTGPGYESVALAEHGYDVIAVDKDFSNFKAAGHERIRTIQKDIADFDIEDEAYNIIIAKNSLPFLADKKTVKKVVGNMANGLAKNGILYFTLFGPKDEWFGKIEMSFFEYEEIMAFLNTLPIEFIHRSTEEGYAPKMDGSIKYWHIHKFLVKKPVSKKIK